jgi:hypothetical protein
LHGWYTTNALVCSAQQTHLQFNVESEGNVMSMMTMTNATGSVGHADRVREPSFFDRLMAAIRISSALRSNTQPHVSDLETLGIADAYKNYLNDRQAAQRG